MRKLIKKIKRSLLPRAENVIISEVSGNVPLYSNKNACVFCHHDSDGQIDDYVINILRNIKTGLGCSIIFVSNSANLLPREVEKIKDLVALSIVKSNIGYDFDAFRVGFSKIAGLEKFTSIYFANDSFYGPFTNFSDVAEAMGGYDMWGLTDSIVPVPHIQSYFLAFRLNERTRAFLEGFWDEYKLLHCKHEIVTNYEIGISRRALAAGLKIGSYCRHEDVINSQKAILQHDHIEKELEKDFIFPGQDLDNKIKAMRNYGLSAKRSARKKLYRKNSNAVDNPCLKDWYTLLKYHKCPVLKIRLLRDPAFFKYHYFNHESALKELYPEFDAGMIRRHLQRVGMR